MRRGCKIRQLRTCVTGSASAVLGTVAHNDRRKDRRVSPSARNSYNSRNPLGGSIGTSKKGICSGFVKVIKGGGEVVRGVGSTRKPALEVVARSYITIISVRILFT